MRRIIAKNWRPFAAIVGLVAVAAVVGGYILDQQRFRFPLIESEPMHIEVEFDNAQAVTPGQGQTAQVAGVQIGDITAVELKDGRAVVELSIKKRFEKLIHRDARALLRPRTGLKDMYVQIFPGGEGAPVRDGFTIRVSRTRSDVDLDEILSVLDADTRDYLVLLANGAGTGLRGRGNDLAEVFKRFEPTFRDLARVNRAVGRERVALRRLVSSLAAVNGQLARRSDDVAELVDSGATTFDAFARQDDQLRETVSELAPTLRTATRSLTAVTPFARELGPTTRALIPAVKALDVANSAIRPFAREATPIVRTKVRPFIREGRPLTADLRPAAVDLARSFPELRRDLAVLNDFVNMAAYNPNGREGPDRKDREEGYLFWLAWVAHQTTNLQNVDDANGPMRPVFLTGTCVTLTSLVNDMPQLEFLMNLSPLLANVCSNPRTSSVNVRKALSRIGLVSRKKEVRR